MGIPHAECGGEGRVGMGHPGGHPSARVPLHRGQRYRRGGDLGATRPTQVSGSAVLGGGQGLIKEVWCLRHQAGPKLRRCRGPIISRRIACSPMCSGMQGHRGGEHAVAADGDASDGQPGGRGVEEPARWQRCGPRPPTHGRRGELGCRRC